MRIFVKDKAFYHSLWVIAIPIALQNLITVAVSMMDTLMIGQLGEVQLSATSIANQLWFMLMVVCFGVAGGANVMLAQYWGKGDTQVMRRVMAMTYKLGLLAALIFSAVALLLPEQFMGIFTVEEEVIHYGAQYLRVIGWSYPLYALGNITIMMLRSIGDVNISVVVYLTSLVVNTSLNYVLIFGKFGAPRLEVRGGAMATVVARCFEFAIAIYYILRREGRICFRLGDLRRSNRDLYGKFAAISLPVIGNEVMWGLGSSAVSVVIGRMGTSFVAANSIYSVLNQFVSVAIFGVGNAALTIVGNTIGSGEQQLARQRSVTFLGLGVLVGAGCTLVTLALGPVLLGFYGNLSLETIQIAQGIIRVGAGIVFFQAFATICMMGVLRAGGDARFVLLCEMAFLWGIAVPLGFVTGLVLHWPAAVVFLFLRCDEVLKAIVSFFRVTSFKWLRDVTG